MHISRIVIRNFRNFKTLDVKFGDKVTCIIGENNTGKSNLLFAIRLALDANLSSQYRQLEAADVHRGTRFTEPLQVLIAIEFSGFSSNDKEMALVGEWACETSNTARVMFRYRPKADIVDEYDADIDLPPMTQDDFHWQIVGGGACDPLRLEWHEDVGIDIRFSCLQNFQIVTLPALRDVISDLMQQRVSPLRKILTTIEKNEIEEQEMVDILAEANTHISNKPSIKEVGATISDAFAKTAGEAYDLGISLGLAEPNFGAIAKSLTLLLSNAALPEFEISRNGLGINNVIYSSMILEYFRRCAQRPNIAGQLLLIEEPEAHLHPQLQRTLYASLADHGCQALVTTHSPYITSLSPLDSYVILTQEAAHTSAAKAVADAGLTEPEKRDLKRYLDATRSPLLFARKVILVEGPAELFLIPALLKAVKNIDIDRHGISVVPIHGTHFSVYCKLLNGHAMAKKCAVIADLDIPLSTPGDEELLYELASIKTQQNVFLWGFACLRTFERSLVIPGTIPMIEKAAEEFGSRALLATIAAYKTTSTPANLTAVRDATLKAADSHGKARFAQVAASYAPLATALPVYIESAINWLLQ